MNKFILSSQLKDLLKRNNCNLTDLARDTDIAPSTIHGWLNGLDPKGVIKLKRVADYFGVSIDYLCFGIIEDERTIEFSEIINLPKDISKGSYHVSFIKVHNDHMEGS